jgi:hypothetical protein
MIEDAIEMGRGPFGHREYRPKIEARALALPSLLRRLRSIAIRLERTEGHSTEDTIPVATDAAARRDLEALVQLDPARGIAVQDALRADGGNAHILIRQAVARLRATRGGKGGRPSHGPDFEAVVGLATRAFDIAMSGKPKHLSIGNERPEKPAPTSQDRLHQETGPRVRFTTALLRVAFPHVALGPATIRHTLARLARSKCC